MFLSILGIIIPIVLVIITAVYIKFYRIPKLDIEILYEGGSSKNLGLNPHNDRVNPIPVNEAIWNFVKLDDN